MNARRCTASLAQALWRGAGRDQGAAAAAPALGQRSLQTSCDDRDIGSNTFDRKVRVYDKNGKLSRHMNPEIDEIVLKFETSLGLSPLMSASPPCPAHSNPPSPDLGYTHTQTAHPSRHISHKPRYSLQIFNNRSKEWEKYQEAAAKLISVKTQRFANYVGAEKSERLLSRKVCKCGVSVGRQRKRGRAGQIRLLITKI